jgi:hypothetical protein
MIAELETCESGQGALDVLALRTPMSLEFTLEAVHIVERDDSKLSDALQRTPLLIQFPPCPFHPPFLFRP